MLCAIIFILLSGNLLYSSDVNKIPVTTKSETAKGYFLQAREWGDKLDAQKAIEFYTKAIKEDPDFALAYIERSFFQNSGKDLMADVEKAVSLENKVSEGEKLLIEATQANVNGDVKKEKEIYDKILSSFPDDERVLTQAGQFYSNQQEQGKAISLFQKAIEKNPQFSPAYNLLGYAYRNDGKLTESEATFKKYISLLPNDPNPYDSYAELLLKQGKFDESIQNYQKALSINPNFNSSRTGIVAAYLYQGKPDQARQEINNFLSSANSAVDKENAHRIMAISYLYDGQFDKALSEFDNEYKIAESENDYVNMANIQNRMGLALYENGELDQAKEKFNASLDNFNKSAASQDAKDNFKNNVTYNETLINLKQQDNSSAAAKSQDISISSNDENQNKIVHKINAIKAIDQKDGDASLNELKQANQNDPYVFYLMGRSYQLKGDQQNAKLYFDKAINYNGLPTINTALAYYNAKKYSSQSK